MPTLLTVASALSAAFVFDRLGVPAGALLGGVAGAAAVNLLASFDAATVPTPVRFLAFAALGWAIGEGVTGESLHTLRSSLGVVVVTVFVLVVAGVVLAFALTRLGMADGTTAYLATSPGALSQIVALSADTDADSLLVATTHLSRVIAVLIVTPLVSQWLAAGAGALP